MHTQARLERRNFSRQEIPGKVENSFRLFPQSTERSLFTDALWALRTPLDKLFGLNKLEQIYCDLSSSENMISFISHALQKLGVSYSVSQEDLQRIPKEGTLMVVANHPYGALDGLILGDILLSRRADVKLMANHMLGRVRELHELLLLVDPYARASSPYNNMAALKNALAHLRGGGTLGVFPAGDVAHWRFHPPGIHEGTWTTQVARLIKHTQATVVPVYFGGGNGLLFHVLGLLHPRFRTAMLTHELTNKRDKQICVKIGKPIPASHLESLEDDERCMHYLRMRSLILHRRTEKAKPKFSLFSRKANARHRPLLSPVLQQSLAMEMHHLPKSQILFESGEFSVAYAQAEQTPLIIREISRLREQAFRLVGEGTGEAYDMDAFDGYYTHLFLWNQKRSEIAGAYRLGRSDEILQRLGQRGMYTARLFKLAPIFFERLGPALEMGRSFVSAEYQKSYAPLLLLWKGIATYVVRFPKYKILFGPVSITNDYKNISRQLMAAFFERRNPDKELAKLVAPRIPFRCASWIHELAKQMPDNEAELVSLLGDIEVDKGLPVLMRQYLKLGGTILRFNLDPSFSNALDGLIVVHLLKTDKRQLERYMGKEGVEAFGAFHRQGWARAA
ncbi:MAG: lysophospholipid acyltransferase family protein [Cystobacterineae bacterium]|nr:lysophospholipid acyltransferase family protein [Cystobacterineae bacterium]